MGESVIGYEGSFYRVAVDVDELGEQVRGTPGTAFLRLPVVWAATGDGEPQESLLRAGAITSVRPS